MRRIDGGRFTGHVFETMMEKEILRFEGPLGSFFLRETPPRPIVMVAGGTGFAPIKGIVEHAIHIGLQRPITLYLCRRAGCIMDAFRALWEAALPGLRYVPVLVGRGLDDAGPGVSGGARGPRRPLRARGLRLAPRR